MKENQAVPLEAKGTRIAQLAVSAAVYTSDKPYSYLLPEALGDRAAVGMRVLVPFGRGNRSSEGLILSLEEGEREPGMKYITALLDEEPILSTEGLRLAVWLREHCFCTLYEAIRGMLPAGLWFSLRDRYRISDTVTVEQVDKAAELSPACAAVLRTLAATDTPMEQADLHRAVPDPTPALRQLLRQGIIVKETSVSRGVGEKKIRFAALAGPADEMRDKLAGKEKTAPARWAVVEQLTWSGRMPVEELQYYTGVSSSVITAMRKAGLLEITEEPVFRRPSHEAWTKAGPVTLTEEQQNAYDELRRLRQTGEPAVSLLCGVTGSGKTAVYIRLIEDVLAEGKSAIVLVPEIALTPQLLQRFGSHFGDRVAVLHSRLTAGERYDEWRRIRTGEARVVLGTRSAVFAPCTDLGLIVLDEEQEHTYKSENTPRYHARDAAKYRCVQNRCLLLLGSATPSVESMYHARQGAYRLLTLKSRYESRPLPEVVITDMRQELRNGNGGTLSTRLREELRQNLDRGEQSILFINRRGNSPMVHCGACGEVPFCPRCSVRLTYHSVNRRLMCHYCGHSQPMPEACPVCGGKLGFIGAGTQRVQEELAAVFPDAAVLRMDADTLAAEGGHEAILSRFERERIPILLGTQMVTKGLDFANVTLVGVLAADLSLYVDDYRAGERTFSLITQVVGRAGRGEKPGRAVIQTYTPDSEVIRTAARQDYDAFYEAEIARRQLHGYPPLRDRFVLTVTGLEELAVLQGARRACDYLRDALARTDLLYQTILLGPAPAAIVKIKERYRYRITVCGVNDKTMRAVLANTVGTFHRDKRNRGLTAFVDHDPES